jgi:hypothetical protein
MPSAEGVLSQRDRFAADVTVTTKANEDSTCQEDWTLSHDWKSGMGVRAGSMMVIKASSPDERSSGRE